MPARTPDAEAAIAADPTVAPLIDLAERHRRRCALPDADSAAAARAPVDGASRAAGATRPDRNGTPASAPPRPGRYARLRILPLAVGALVVLALIAASLLVGVYDVLGAADGGEMLAITRVPRTIALVLAGAAMAMSGLVMQQLTQNRFVEPTTTGTTEWAGLGLLAVMIVAPGASLLVKMAVAIAAAFGGTMVFFLVLRRIRLRSSIIVPIVGIMLGAVVGAASTYLALATDLLQSMGVWFLGSFTSVLRGQYEPLWLILLVVVAVAVAADRFTVVGLGQDFATNAGVDYARVLLVGTGLVAAATGIVTVVVGNLPFLGLIVPNIVSRLRGDDLRSNLPWVCLLGVGAVTACDIIGRVVVMPFEIPVSVILSIVGAAVFIGLLLKRRADG